MTSFIETGNRRRRGVIYVGIAESRQRTSRADSPFAWWTAVLASLFAGLAAVTALVWLGSKPEGASSLSVSMQASAHSPKARNFLAGFTVSLPPSDAVSADVIWVGHGLCATRVGDRASIFGIVQKDESALNTPGLVLVHQGGCYMRVRVPMVRLLLALNKPE